MTPERTNSTQLPLPFQPNPIVLMTPEERSAALSALVQMLLSAARQRMEETCDEH